MASVKKKKAKTSSPQKRDKAGFTPEELRWRTRFFKSLLGKIITGFLAALVLLLFNVLVSGQNIDLFFLLTGIECLLAMIAFWLLLLLRRAVRP